MKKSLLLSLFALMAMVAVAATYPASYYTIAPETATVVGDVNCDQIVTAADVTELYNYLLNNSTTYYSTSDVTGDGEVTAADVTAVYDVLLNGSGGSNQGTVITFKDYLAGSTGTPPNHMWQVNTDVIYITLDGVEQNMYVMVLTRNGWVLKDITGSSKAGFATSGNLQALWVRNGSWSTDQVYNISIPYDYATGEGTYTRNGTTVSINLNLSLGESKVRLSGNNMSTAYSMTYCSHVTKVYNVNSMCLGSGTDYYDATTTPQLQYFDGTYVVFAKQTDLDNSGRTVLHCTMPDGKSYRRTASYELKPGMFYGVTAPDYNYSYWTRDFVLRYYDQDNSRTTKYIDYGTSTVRITVGTQLTFSPCEGSKNVGTSVTGLSHSVGNSSVVELNYNSNNNSAQITGLKVGSTNVILRYNDAYGDSYAFIINVVVDPTVWTLGVRNGSPVLLRNNVVQYSSFPVETNSFDRVFVVKGKAYLKADGDNTSYLLRSTNPHSHGSFSIRKTTPMDKLLVTSNEDIYHVYNNVVFKNNIAVHTSPCKVVDIVEDLSTGYVWTSESFSGDETGSNVYGLLVEDVGNQKVQHRMNSWTTTITVGGMNPTTAVGSVSPHFGKISIQNGFILIDGYESIDAAYRPQDGGAVVWYTRFLTNETFTYDGSNGYIAQCSRGFNKDRFVFFDNTRLGENVYWNSNVGLKAYYIHNGSDVELNSSIPADNIKATRYKDGIIYAVGYNKLWIINTSTWTCTEYPFQTDLTSIKDMYLETSLN